MHIDLTANEVKYIRAVLTLVLVEHEELIDTGRLARELGEDTVLEAGRASDEYEEKLRAILTKLPTV